MDLKPLFEKQRTLDNRIIEEKELDGQDLLLEKILALQVELGELANEWRGFKFWSEDQEPRTKVKEYLPNHGLAFKYKNSVLEEYVDCLHFILSIGLELLILDEWEINEIEVDYELTVVHQFLAFNRLLNDEIDAQEWFEITSLFIGLGDMLGFTWDQIEQAYMEKNKINHQRQSNGY